MVEYFNMDWCKPKKICDLRKSFDQGHFIFAEDNDPKTQFNEFHWYKALMSDNDLFKLYINTSHFLGDGDNVLTIKIKKDQTLDTLKNKISKKLGIKSDEFNVKRQNVVKEFKDLSLTMVNLGITSGALLKIERGKPHIEGKYELIVNLARVLNDYVPEEQTSSAPKTDA